MSFVRRHAMRSCARCLSVLLAAMVLLLSPGALSVAGADSGSAEPVYLLNAMYSPDPSGVTFAQAMWLGIDAALHHANYTAFGGRPIEIVSPSSSVNQSDIVAVTEAAVAEHPSLLAVIGPFSDPVLLEVLGSATLQESSLVFFAPLTESSAVRTWSDNVYFTRAEPQLQVLVIVKHIANTLRVRRTAFMYLSGAGYGDAECEKFVLLMAKLSLAPAVLYTAPYSTTRTAVNTTAFDAMADTSPQVIVLWSVSGAQTQNFLQAVLTDPRTSSAYIISSFALQQEVFDVYYGLAMAGVITPVAGQVLSSATVFPLTEPGTDHIPMFMAQMSRYMKDTGNVNVSLWADEATYVAKYGSSYASAAGSSSYADAFLHEHPNTAQLMLTGWIAGTLLMQTLMEPSYITSAAAYQAGLFQQHRYMVGGDFVLGDYGGPCNDVADFLTALCYCNQGGHAAIMQTLSNASWSTVTVSGVNYSQSDCYSTDVYLPGPLNQLQLAFEDDPELQQLGVDMTDAFTAFLGYLRYTDHPVNYALLSVTDETAQSLLNAQLDDYTASFVTSSVAANLDVRGYLVPSPLFARPHLVQPEQNYVYLMPTLEQQTYLLYQNLATVQRVTAIGSSVQAILRGYESGEVANITAMLQMSAATFNYDDPAVLSVQYVDSISSSLAAGSINYIVGMAPADVPAVADFLSSDAAAIVVVPFDDLALQYAAVVNALASLPASVQARFLTFSSLPLWTDTSAAAQAASPLLTQFFAALPDAADHTPSKLLGVLVAGFLLNLVSGMDGVNASNLVSNVYVSGVLSVYGVTLGSYSWGCAVSTTGQTCEYVNYGAQNIAMLSVRRMLEPSVLRLTRPMTPSMVYTPRRVSGLTTAQRSGVIAGAVVGGAVVVAAVVLLVYCVSRCGRDNKAAPQDSDEPVTLIFTDIESSTAMWAAVPQEMADAIAAHHRVIRKLIRKYGCYEVKTIGDSFMIACKDAYSAVCLVSEMQTRLLEYDWGTQQIDSKYREFERAKVDTVEGYEPTTAQLSEEEYAALWCGLRVRVGVHTGLSDIRYDEVTKGYDYYGDTSNMAARTEAVANGGQVVATEATWWALSDDERDAVQHTTMGPQGLRGVPFAVGMYQLDAVPGRTHAALRTEIEATLPDGGADETASSGAESLLSSPDAVGSAAAGVAVALGGCFAPYPPAQRVRELQPLLHKWHVSAPPRPPQLSEEDYCQGLINRLAVRVANVAQVRQNAWGSEVSGKGHVSSPSSGPVSNPLRRPPTGGSLPRLPSAASDLPHASEHVVSPPESRRVTTVFDAPLPMTSLRLPHSTKHPLSSGSYTSDNVLPFGPPRALVSRPASARGDGSVVEEVLVRMPSGHGLRQRMSRSGLLELSTDLM